MSVTLRAAAFAVGLFAIAGPASAAPADDFVARLNLWLAPTLGSVEVTLPGGKSKSGLPRQGTAVLMGPGTNVELGDSVTFGPITTLPGDIMVAESILIEDFDREESGLRVRVDSIKLTQVILPPPGTTDPYLLAQMVGAISLEGIIVEENSDLLMIERFTVGMGVEPEIATTEPTSFVLVVSVIGVLLNETLLGATEIGNIGPLVDAVRGQRADFIFPLHWDIATGVLGSGGAQIAVPGLGNFGLTMEVGGVTLPLVSEVVAFAAKQADGGGPDAEAEQQAIGLKLLSQLTYNAASFTLTDMGMVDIAFEAAEDEMDLTRDELEFLMIDGIDDGLGEIGVSDTFIEGAVTELLKFVRTGGNLAFNAYPAAPVSAIELVALSQSPALVLEKIGLGLLQFP